MDGVESKNQVHFYPRNKVFPIQEIPDSPSYKKYAFFAVNESEAWVATFLEADLNKTVTRLSIIRNLDMHRIAVVLLQSIAYSIVANQKLFIVFGQANSLIIYCLFCFASSLLNICSTLKMSDLNYTAERSDNLQEIGKNLDILANIFDSNARQTINI